MERGEKKKKNTFLWGCWGVFPLIQNPEKKKRSGVDVEKKKNGGVVSRGGEKVQKKKRGNVRPKKEGGKRT